MTDDEAEAVMRALGEALVWTPWHGIRFVDEEWERLVPVLRKVRPGPQTEAVVAWHREKKTIVEAALVEDGYYSIRVRRKWWGLPVYTAGFLGCRPHSISQHPDRFTRRDAAKAACDRHHATGIWDAGPTPESATSGRNR